MAQKNDAPGPVGEVLNKVNSNPEENQAQHNSDAPPDATVDPDARLELTDADADGELRRKLHEKGATLLGKM